MERVKASIEGVLTDFLKPILPNIGGEPTREGLIELYQLFSENAASMSLNLRGVRHRHLSMKITSKE